MMWPSRGQQYGPARRPSSVCKPEEGFFMSIDRRTFLVGGGALLSVGGAVPAARSEAHAVGANVGTSLAGLLAVNQNDVVTTLDLAHEWGVELTVAQRRVARWAQRLGLRRV